MIILAAYLIGLMLEYVLNFPVPGVVSGLIILFLALLSGLLKQESIRDVADFLLSHMSFFFLAPGVGLMTTVDVLRGNILPFTVIILVTTVIVWSVTAFTVKMLRRIIK